MNKTLGAVALLGASALVLAGCAGGNDAASDSGDGAEIRVWLVGADTPQEALCSLQQRLKCGTSCGSCVPELKAIILHESMARAEAI